MACWRRLPQPKEHSMKRFGKTAVAVGVAGALALAATTPAMARNWRGHHWGGALGAGIVAGTVLGIGAAAAANNYNNYYDEPYGYYGSYDAAPVYTAPAYNAYGYAPGYDAYGYAPDSRARPYAYTPPRYPGNGPNREDQLTGSGIGAVQ
jgi:hypothetical protein